jgi:hypothetical protein
MKEARKAMDKAIKIQADKLASTDFQQARKSWDKAQAAEKEGNTGAAKVLFTSAKINYGKAAAIAKSKQDALSRELIAMQVMISKNLDQVKIDLSKGKLPPQQRGRVRAIVSEVEKDEASIKELVAQEELVKAVAAAKDVQTKIYNAQLILAGKKPKQIANRANRGQATIIVENNGKNINGGPSGRP